MNQNFLGISALEGRRDRGDSALPEPKHVNFLNSPGTFHPESVLASEMPIHPSIHPLNHSTHMKCVKA